MLTSLDELSAVDGANAAVVSAIKSSYSLGTFGIRSVEVVGPKVGAELRRQAIYVTLYALGGMPLYIAFRFHGSELVGPTSGNQGNIILRSMDKIIFGTAAVLAVFHDVLITLGFFSIFKFEISLTVIAALLDAGRLFDERHDCHLRPHSGKQPPAAPGIVCCRSEQVH